MQLARYEARARKMTAGELLYALRDLSETLAIWRERDTSDPYVAKLLAEFDAYSVEISQRRA